MTKYRTVQLPENLIKEIIKELKDNNELAYRSHSEFIIDATRRRLEEIKKLRSKLKI